MERGRGWVDVAVSVAVHGKQGLTTYKLQLQQIAFSWRVIADWAIRTSQQKRSRFVMPLCYP